MHSWLLLAEAATPKGGLFDLDATLPLMAVQVVVLTFVLNALFFRPVGKTVEDREGYLSTSRAHQKQVLTDEVRDATLATLRDVAAECGIHVLIGMAVMVWLMWLVMKDKIGKEFFTPVDLGGLYWHLVDLIWIYLFPLLYLVE